ncbi:MAG: DUF305 domain-containing protein [Rhodospirillales bacterium]|nr:DUF305 domain-containing protein [Rhodospirillales bacterium]MDE2318984.1 DUF305 domain-containing protein [Rhodospirillales bacterium]
MLLAGLTALTAPVAFAQTASNGMGMGGASTQMAGDAADKALMSGMAKMSHDMANAPETGNADQDFVAMMIPHHAGAISMAEAELRYGHDPYLRHMAQDIITAQNREIAEMKNWQKAHPAP